MAVVALSLVDKVDSSWISISETNEVISNYILGVLWHFNWRMNFEHLSHSDQILAGFFLSEEIKWLEEALKLLALKISLSEIILGIAAIKKYGGTFTPLKIVIHNRQMKILNHYLEYVELVFDYETGEANVFIYEPMN